MNEILDYDTTPISGCAITPDIVPGQHWSVGAVELGQNYPNPHTGETSVPFTLAIAADIRLTILDGLGRKVTGVVRKGRSPGPQSIKLNLTGLGLAPGEYEYRLEATTKSGLYQQSKRMSTE